MLERRHSLVVNENENGIFKNIECPLMTQVGVRGLNYKNLPFGKMAASTHVRMQTIYQPDSSFNVCLRLSDAVAVN